jgi:hypothetical protein
MHGYLFANEMVHGPCAHMVLHDRIYVDYRSSQCFFQDFKRAGISRLLKEKGREQVWPKKGNLRRRKKLKNGQNFTTFRVNKMFSHKF